MSTILYFVFGAIVEGLDNYRVGVKPSRKQIYKFMGYNSESKEEIKDRMIRTALDYWNIRKVENLDPLVRLLIESLAMQLHNVSDDIADIEARVMRRMSEVLLPEVVTVVHPAHAVVHVETVGDELKTGLYDGFSTVALIMGRRDGKSLSFYPVCETKLRRGDVRMIVAENSVYEVLSDQNKRLLLKKQVVPENVNKVYVGLEFEKKDIDLTNLSLYFDFPNTDRRNDYLHYLSSATFRFNGEPLQVSRGLHTDGIRQQKHIQGILDGLGNDQSVNASIVDYYKMSYVTIDSQLLATVQDFANVPTGFKIQGDDEYFNVFKKDLIWLEIDFPPQFSSSVIADMQVSINTFPVSNKELRKLNSLVKKDFGVIPLPVGDSESFFDVVEVTDEYGTIYNKENGYKNGRSDMSYTLRQGGCESFDKRDARDFLIRLQGAMEEEWSRFAISKNGNDVEGDNLIEQLLRKIERRTQNAAEKNELPYYLFVEPQKPSSFFYLKYWTSYGSLANGMRIGQTLNPMGDSYGEYSRPVFLTTTVNGMAPPSERMRIAKFKYILSSRNRIVTNNDIKNFCFSECCEDISDVEIRKGISRGVGSDSGLQRTIDVFLILKNKEMSEAQKRKLSDDMREKLVGQSPMTFNYRVFCR